MTMINSKTIFLTLNGFEALLLTKALKFTKSSNKTQIDLVTHQVLNELTQRIQALARGETTTE